MIIDDDSSSVLRLNKILTPHFDLHHEYRLSHILPLLQQFPIRLLIVNAALNDEGGGLARCRQLKQQNCTLPVLMLSGNHSVEYEARGLSLGVVDFIYNTSSAAQIMQLLDFYLLHSVAQGIFNRHQMHLEIDLAVANQHIIHKTSQLLISRVPHHRAAGGINISESSPTANHIRRTQHYVRLLASYLSRHHRFASQLDLEQIELLFQAVPFHDLGKVAIPEQILHKPDSLNQDEWCLMRRHAEFGRDVLLLAEQALPSYYQPLLRCAREIAFHHHEKWDGSGYPLGLVGDQIPLAARLMAMADVYDALTSQRVYKPALAHDAALRMITAERGRHFDPDMTDAMLFLSDELREISLQFADCA